MSRTKKIKKINENGFILVNNKSTGESVRFLSTSGWLSYFEDVKIFNTENKAVLCKKRTIDRNELLRTEFVEFVVEPLSNYIVFGYVVVKGKVKKVKCLDHDKGKSLTFLSFEGVLAYKTIKAAIKDTLRDNKEEIKGTLAEIKYLKKEYANELKKLQTELKTLIQQTKVLQKQK